MKKLTLQVEMSTNVDGSTQTDEIEIEIKEGLTPEEEQEEFSVYASEWALETMNLTWKPIS